VEGAEGRAYQMWRKSMLSDIANAKGENEEQGEYSKIREGNLCIVKSETVPIAGRGGV
jgi:hypothetical protein